MPSQKLTLFWPNEPTLYAPARYRKACQYEAYVPAPLSEQVLNVSAESIGIISDAEGAIRELNAFARPALAPLARLLLRTESIASSKVEGLQVGIRQIARAQVNAKSGKRIGADTLEVMSNIEAMQTAVDLTTNEDAFTIDHITAIHAHLMATAPNADRIAGRVRTTQNWIGGNDYNPCSADFVPPPPEYLPSLMEDLCDAINSETLPPLMQAALVHAQFETLHPFEDGNGRTGRALIQVVLRRRKLAPDYVPPISIVLANDRDTYIDELTAFRDNHAEQWVAQFAAAASSAAALAQRYLQHVNDLQNTWRDQLKNASGSPRSDAAAWAVIDVLPAYPVLTAPVAERATGRGKTSVYEALQQLVAAGVLTAVSSSARKQSWEAEALLALLNDLENGQSNPSPSR